MRTTILCFAVTCLLSVTSANAELYSRLNGQAVYDSSLNITWTANANLGAILPFGVANVLPSSDSGNQPGSMLGYFSNTWIDALNAYQGTGYLGFNDWRLTKDNCPSSGYLCTDSEFGHLFYNDLGGIAHSPISTSNSPDLSLFTNLIETNWYWTGSLSGEKIKVFYFGDGGNSRVFGTLAMSQIWAVRDGDVASIPEPATAWLLGSGLIVLIGATRKRKAPKQLLPLHLCA